MKSADFSHKCAYRARFRDDLQDSIEIDDPLARHPQGCGAGLDDYALYCRFRFGAGHVGSVWLVGWRPVLGRTHSIETKKNLLLPTFNADDILMMSLIDWRAATSILSVLVTRTARPLALARGFSREHVRSNYRVSPRIIPGSYQGLL
ncbi:hypothetical protein ACVWZR_002081 [Bradyrhizobium sp. i1.3.1]